MDWFLYDRDLRYERVNPEQLFNFSEVYLGLSQTFMIELF